MPLLFNGKKFEGNHLNIEWSSILNKPSLDSFGTCSTSANTVAKVGVLSGYTRRTGSIVGIRFTNANTAANPTLNVNSTGAANIRFNNINLTSNGGHISANMLALFQFDGTYWNLLNSALAGSTSTNYGSAPGIVVTSFTTAGTTTWEVPDANGNNTTWLAEIWIKGAGGGGGMGSIPGSQTRMGGGGGGEGELAMQTRQVMTPGTIYNITVGAGGAGGTSAGTNGTAGGSSSFDTIITASGGAGGYGNTSRGGLGGGSYGISASSTTRRIAGATGGTGNTTYNADGSCGGCGGGHRGGRGCSGTSTAATAGNRGGGGGGGSNLIAGASGGSGYIAIWRLV